MPVLSQSRKFSWRKGLPLPKASSTARGLTRAAWSWTANGATYWFYTDADFAAFKSMLMSMVKNEGYTGNYQNVSKTEQVQVGSHQEDQGHYETETYVDDQYCDCGATR